MSSLAFLSVALPPTSSLPSFSHVAFYSNSHTCLPSSSIRVHFRLLYFNLFAAFVATSAHIWQLWSTVHHLSIICLFHLYIFLLSREGLNLWITTCFTKSTPSFSQLVCLDLLTSSCFSFSFTSLPTTTLHLHLCLFHMEETTFSYFPVFLFLPLLSCLSWVRSERWRQRMQSPLARTFALPACLKGTLSHNNTEKRRKISETDQNGY